MYFQSRLLLWFQTLAVLVLLFSFTVRAVPTSESSEECDDVSEKFTRSRCEPNVCGAENNKRDYVNETDVEEDEVDDDSGHLSSLPFLSVSDDNNETISSETGLTKRAFEWPGGRRLDRYIMRVTKGRGRNGLTPLISDPSTSTSVFEQFGDEPLHIGTGDLCGCTSLFIVSDEAVYAAHYYESLAFDNDPGFKKQVTRFLLRKRPWTTGNNGGSYPGLAQVAHYFDPRTTRAYIMTPALQVGERFVQGPDLEPVPIPIYDVSRGGQYEYLQPEQNPRNQPWIHQLRDTVGDIIRVRPSIRVYEAADCDWEGDRLDNTVSGRALFEYDPDSVQARLFFENRLVMHRDVGCT